MKTLKHRLILIFDKSIILYTPVMLNAYLVCLFTCYFLFNKAPTVAPVFWFGVLTCQYMVSVKRQYRRHIKPCFWMKGALLNLYILSLLSLIDYVYNLDKTLTMVLWLTSFLISSMVVVKSYTTHCKNVNKKKSINYAE